MIASASRHTTELAPCSFTGGYSSQACKRLAKETPLTLRVHSSRYVRSLSGPSSIMGGIYSECIEPSTSLLIGCRGSEPGFEQTRGQSIAVPALSSHKPHIYSPPLHLVISRVHQSFRRRMLWTEWSAPFSRIRRALSLVGSMLSLRLGWSVSSHTRSATTLASSTERLAKRWK